MLSKKKLWGVLIAALVLFAIVPGAALAEEATVGHLDATAVTAIQARVLPPPTDPMPEGTKMITEINNRANLEGFIAQYKASPTAFDGVTVNLNADIAWGDEWTPLPHQFNGTFNGNGHTIDVTITKTTAHLLTGFFEVVGSEGTVKNLTVSGEIIADDNVGGIAGYNLGTIEGCTYDGLLKSDDGNSITGAGGIAGVNMGTIRLCEVTEDSRIIRSGCYVGGIAGINLTTSADMTAIIDGCLNHGLVRCTSVNKTLAGGTGGIVGLSQVVEDKDIIKKAGVQIRGCENDGKIDTSASVTGGIAGMLDNGKLENCINSGAVEDTDYGLWTGGIVGSFDQHINLDNQGDIYIRNCTNTAPVTGIARVGGIVGGIQDFEGIIPVNEVSLCVNSGDITTFSPASKPNGYVGGLVGYGAGAITRSYNMGDVYNNDPEKDYNGAGGIVGGGYADITDCFNLGAIDTQVPVLKDDYDVGGIAGHCSSITRCYNSGALTGNQPYIEEAGNKVAYGGVIGHVNSNGGTYVERLYDAVYNTDNAGKAAHAIGHVVNSDLQTDELSAQASSDNNVKGLTAREMTGSRAKTNLSDFMEKGFVLLPDETVGGVTYSFTPVYEDLTSPLEMGMDVSGWSYAHIVIPSLAGDGYTLVPQEGFDAADIPVGGSFDFTVALDAAHAGMTASVTVDGTAIAPDADGVYHLTNLQAAPDIQVALTAADNGQSNQTDQTSTNNVNTGLTQNADYLPLAAGAVLFAGIILVVLGVLQYKKSR
jgi:hypothetical protein